MCMYGVSSRNFDINLKTDTRLPAPATQPTARSTTVTYLSRIFCVHKIDGTYQENTNKRMMYYSRPLPALCY